MAALHYLKHLYALNDEDTAPRWSQTRTGSTSAERYFQHELPCDPSSLVRVKRARLDTAVLDTAVQPRAIAHPTDICLLNRAREQLVDTAQDAGTASRQSDARVGKAAEHQAGGYAHAEQYRRMQREIRKLRTWLGRVIRDVQRKGGEIAGALKAKLAVAQRLHAQRRNSKDKLYALHAPDLVHRPGQGQDIL